MVGAWEKPRSTEVFEGKRSSLNMDLSNVEISREQNDELMKKWFSIGLIKIIY